VGCLGRRGATGSRPAQFLLIALGGATLAQSKYATADRYVIATVGGTLSRLLALRLGFISSDLGSTKPKVTGSNPVGRVAESRLETVFCRWREADLSRPRELLTPARGPRLQQLALARVAAERGGAGELHARLFGAPEPLEQLAARRRQ